MQLTDWGVIVGYLLLTTLLGGWLAGRQATIRDFFLAGRKLPWPAVCGSIIATEISAVTFVGVPALAFAVTGDLTYLMLSVGTIIARFIIGYLFVPAYYEREIYSPYEYMGQRLGAGSERITSGLFFVSGVLGQGVRVYITAVVLVVVLGLDRWLLQQGWVDSAEQGYFWGLVICIWVIALVAILWTWMGGITTVVWTDVIQFFIFACGGVFAIFWLAHVISDGSLFNGLALICREGAHAVTESGQSVNKFRLWNFSLDPRVVFTFWAGLIGGTLMTLSSHGTDQMNAQRMFCCRSAADARKAIIWSSVGVLLAVVMLFVGIGLYAFYRTYPGRLSLADQTLLGAQSNAILPLFILREMPAGLRGLLFAAIFAAAITSLDSILAALSQTSITSFYQPLIRPHADEKHYLRVSRLFVLLWGVALSLMAIVCIVISRDARFKDLINLALSMTSYTYGALLGVFLLAFLPLGRDGRGLWWSVPLSVLTIFGMSWPGLTVTLILLVGSLVLLGTAAVSFRAHPRRLLPLVGGIILMWALASLDRIQLPSADGTLQPLQLAYPWNYPIGVFITLGLGWVLGEPKDKSSSR